MPQMNPPASAPNRPLFTRSESGSNAERLNKRTLKERLSTLVDDIDKHEIFMISGSLAYTTALSVAPFLLIMLSIASFLPNNLQSEIYAGMSSAAGEQASHALRAVVENADARPQLSTISGIIGFIILAVSASTLFMQMRQALNKINEYEAPVSTGGIMAFIKERFFSVGLVFGFAFLLVASLLLSTLVSLLFNAGEGFLWELLATAVSFIVFSLVFSCIYRFIPSEKKPWSDCLKSGMISAGFYLVGKSLIGLYLGKAGLGEAYGAAGSLIVFLAWVYYTSLTFLVSYEVRNHFFHRHT